MCVRDNEKGPYVGGRYGPYRGGGWGLEGSPYNGERTFCQRWFVDDVLCVCSVCVGRGWYPSIMAAVALKVNTV